MTPEAKAIFDRCDEYVREALANWDKGAMAQVPLALRPLVAPRMAELRNGYGGGLRDAYLTAVWETLMGRAMPWVESVSDWEAEIQAALENRF